MIANRWNRLIGLTLVSMLFTTAARAQGYNCYGAECLPSTTTTLATTAATVGIVVLIVMLVTKKDTPPPQDAAKAAELYLRQNSLQLVQDLSTGSGPVIDDLSGSLRISRENMRTFQDLVRKDRKELLALADVRQLDPTRAVQFVQRVVTLMQSRPELARDLDRLTSAPATN